MAKNHQPSKERGLTIKIQNLSYKYKSNVNDET